MAIVTFGTPAARRIILGDLVTKFFVVNGPSGSTLPTGLSQLLWWDIQQYPQGGGNSVITNMTQSGGTLTITSSGTMVNEVIQVWGREG